MQLVDTHCHIHEATLELDNAAGQATRSLWQKAGSSPDDLVSRAAQAGVTQMICVGTSAEDSELAVQFVQNRPECWASIGIHPHEAKDGQPALQRLSALLANRESSLRQDPRSAQSSKIVAIGECGLDYYYTHSPKKAQTTALHYQIELALEHNLPLIFHVRDAFDDFWPIFDSHKNLRGVLHSFTDTPANADKALERGLCIGLNGIITFTKHDWQLQLAKRLPLQKILLETDAPYLTPVPHRGTVNMPSRVRDVAQFLATLRGEPLKKLAAQTTKNARALFSL